MSYAKEYLENNKNLKEESEKEKTKKAIDAIIDTSWSGSNEEQMKIVNLLKGIATSDEKISNDFMKALDKATSELKKNDFE